MNSRAGQSSRAGDSPNLTGHGTPVHPAPACSLDGTLLETSIKYTLWCHIQEAFTRAVSACLLDPWSHRCLRISGDHSLQNKAIAGVQGPALLVPSYFTTQFLSVRHHCHTPGSCYREGPSLPPYWPAAAISRQ